MAFRCLPLFSILEHSPSFCSPSPRTYLDFGVWLTYIIQIPGDRSSHTISSFQEWRAVFPMPWGHWSDTSLPRLGNSCPWESSQDPAPKTYSSLLLGPSGRILALDGQPCSCSGAGPYKLTHSTAHPHSPPLALSTKPEPVTTHPCC